MPKTNKCSDGAGDHYGWMIECPACGNGHLFDKRWTFNGDVDRPTFTPSMLIKTGHYAAGHSGPCWCDYNREHPNEPSKFECGICHSIVTDGKIAFCSDSTHKLAGQTVDLPDL